MTRILFVDDDPCILGGLKRAMRRRRQEWEMAFAASGREALEVLASAPFDVVVTDMRMEGMDGAALLTLVRERHPDVVRIILTGRPDLGSGLRAAAVAHQFLGKPCPPALLEATIDRASQLRGLDDRALSRALGEMGGSIGVLTEKRS